MSLSQYNSAKRSSGLDACGAKSFTNSHGANVAAVGANRYPGCVGRSQLSLAQMAQHDVAVLSRCCCPTAWSSGEVLHIPDTSVLVHQSLNRPFLDMHSSRNLKYD